MTAEQFTGSIKKNKSCGFIPPLEVRHVKPSVQLLPKGAQIRAIFPLLLTRLPGAQPAKEEYRPYGDYRHMGIAGLLPDNLVADRSH